MRRDMIMHSCADHDPGSSILNSLQGENVLLRCACQKRVAIVEASVDNRTCNLVRTFRVD